MAIDQRRYVDIASAVVGGTAVALQKLDQRVMTDSPLVPRDSILEFSGAAQVAEHFGDSSAEAAHARAYFAYVSPAPVGRPSAIQYAAHIAQGRVSTVRGSSDIASVSQIAGLGAEADITVTVTPTVGEPATIPATVDVSAAVSYADVASALTAAFAGENEALTFEFTDGVFVASLPGDEYSGAVFESSDLADALGLAEGQAAFDAGGAGETMLAAYNRTTQLNDSFGSVVFLNQGDLDEVVEVAEANAAFNVKHQFYVDVSPEDAETYAAALLGTASVGLLLRRENDPVSLAVLPGAIMSATDYTRTNATTNYMYRQQGVTYPAQVTGDQEANRLDPLRVNYYGRTAVAGGNIEFFQRAFLCGGVLAPVDMSVHANEQWLKAYIAQQWFTLLLSTRGIPANDDGAARMQTILADAVTQALDNGTILAGKTLTPAQRLAIGDASGDDKAWHDVQDKGYWYDVQIVEQTGPSGLPEYVGNYTLIYGKGDWVRKVSGSHNLV